MLTCAPIAADVRVTSSTVIAKRIVISPYLLSCFTLLTAGMRASTRTTQGLSVP
jgi:hypothetical protein